MNGQAGGKIFRQTNRNADRQTERQRDRQVDRQKDRLTDGKTGHFIDWATLGYNTFLTFVLGVYIKDQIKL